jgi:CRISPR-associated protein Cst1
MLRYTGHSLVDVGIATITAFANKQDPTMLSEDDLEAVADYITREYIRQPLKSFLTVAFPNSGFTQPAFEKTPERRLDYAQRVLRSHQPDVEVLQEHCVFTGEPAVAVAFGDKESLPLGRAFRQHIPLTTGEDVINFHPDGDAGLPVSGTAILAIQAFPLGCAKVAGRLLAVHSDNDELMLHFAANFLAQNRRFIQLAQQEGSSKMPEPQYAHKTLLVDTLLSADQMQREARADEMNFSLTAYHLTNSGQGVGLSIYYLPLQIMGFLREMQQAKYHNDWSVIVRRAWQIAPPAKKGGKKPTGDFQPRRNYLYEDIFDLPNNARAFLRTYFLRVAWRYARAELGDPRGSYSLQDESSLVSWKITARFLKRIMNMEKDRIEEIRKLGDQLADYVSGENDRRFFRDFFIERRYDPFRTALIKANLAHVKRGNSPFITLDPYIEVFEAGDEVSRSDWQLARDLVLIRMIERLYQLGWLGKNPDAIPTELEEQTNPAS